MSNEVGLQRIAEPEAAGLRLRKIVRVCWLPKAYTQHCVCEECCDACVCSCCLTPWIGHPRCADAGCVSHFHKHSIRHRVFFGLLWVYRRWWSVKRRTFDLLGVAHA